MFEVKNVLKDEVELERNDYFNAVTIHLCFDPSSFFRFYSFHISIFFEYYEVADLYVETFFSRNFKYST